MNLTMAALKSVIKGVMTKERYETSSFSYYPSTATNITGDNTAWTALYNQKTFNIGNDYDGISTYTAPVTGRYLFTAMISMIAVTTSHPDGRIEIVTSLGDAMKIFAAGKIFESNTIIRPHISEIMHMDAGDTAYIRLTVYSGGKHIDIQNTKLSGTFSGSLLK